MGGLHLKDFENKPKELMKNPDRVVAKFCQAHAMLVSLLKKPMFSYSRFMVVADYFDELSILFAKGTTALSDIATKLAGSVNDQGIDGLEKSGLVTVDETEDGVTLNLGEDLSMIMQLDAVQTKLQKIAMAMSDLFNKLFSEHIIDQVVKSGDLTLEEKKKIINWNIERIKKQLPLGQEFLNKWVGQADDEVTKFLTNSFLEGNMSMAEYEKQIQLRSGAPEMIQGAIDKQLSFLSVLLKKRKELESQ